MNFEIHRLGWKAFQDFCITIVRTLFGQTVEHYYDSYDGGRDGAFGGKWCPLGEEALAGKFTIQCKFTGTPGKLLNLSALSEEFSKAERLGAKGLARNYLLLTNHRVTGVTAEKVTEAFLAIDGIDQVRVYGQEWLDESIRSSARLRMMVPRVYGLGDLTQILDQRAYSQAQAILSSLGDDLSKFVITNAYRKSALAVTEHGFLLLIGEPAAGKSTIAAALALAALDELQCSTVSIRDGSDFLANRVDLLSKWHGTAEGQVCGSP